ncbi:hypothetical protein H0X06_04405 [Candidatus Dependentiae bacterium]|nr:hypothetical protein [Candidatus Dependentiae bacterium]
MARYGRAARASVAQAMKKFKKGTLYCGMSEKKVTNPRQAIAIGLSEARKKGVKVPSNSDTKK